MDLFSTYNIGTTTRVNKQNCSETIVKGATAIIIANEGDHNYGPIGSIFKIRNDFKALSLRDRTDYSVYNIADNIAGNWIRFDEFEIVEHSNDADAINRALKEKTIAKIILKKAADWLDEKGVDDLSPQKKAALNKEYNKLLNNK